MDSGSLETGMRYYVQVATINSADKGPFAIFLTPFDFARAPLSLAHNCKVYAVSDSPTY